MSETQELKPDWTWYRAALAGEPVQYHEGQVEHGYYRRKRRDGEGWEAVGIWPHQGQVVVVVDGVVTNEDPAQAFSFSCRQPIDYSLYRAVTVEKAPWPDMPPELPSQSPTEEETKEYQDRLEEMRGDPGESGMGHNKPPQDEDDPELAHRKQQLEDETKAVNEFLKEPITTQERADKAANWAGRIAKLAGWLKSRYDKTNAPLLQRQREIRDDYLHPSQEAQRLAKSLTDAQTKYLAALQAQRDEAARKAQAAAEEARQKELDEIRKREGEEAAAEAAAEAPPPKVEAQKVTAGGGTGRKTGVSFDVVPHVDDYLALATALIRGEDGKAAPGECLNLDLKDALDKIAKKKTKGKEEGETFAGGQMVRRARARR